MQSDRDPYADGTHRYWTLSMPSPELVAAIAEGRLAVPATVLDLGCGLAVEAAYLAGLGFSAWGVDLSAVALRQAHALHPTVRLVRADVKMLPFVDGAFDSLLDRGTIHYLGRHERDAYAAEAWRVLRPGGVLLLRACLYSEGRRNDIDRKGLVELFSNWNVDRIERQDLRSDTRVMPALVCRLQKS